MPFFEVFKGGRKSGDVQVAAEEAVIGRDAKADVRLDDTTLSRQHARVFSDGTDWVVEDLGTKNGTWVNGVREYRRALRDGDQLQLGGFVLTFRLGAGERAPAPVRKVMTRRERELADRNARRRALEPPPDDDSPTNVVKRRELAMKEKLSQAPDSTRVVDPKQLAKVRRENQLRMGPHLEPESKDADVVPLDRKPVTLGPAKDDDVRVDGSTRGRAVVVRDEKGFVLSRRGLFGTVKVNGRAGRRHVLKPGDVIQVGGSRFTFRGGSKPGPKAAGKGDGADD